MGIDRRGSLDRVRRTLRENGTAAAWTGIVAGAVALAVADHVTADLGAEFVLLPLGVGGSVYYWTHYGITVSNDDSSGRAALTFVVTIVLAHAFVSDTDHISRFVVAVVTAISVVWLLQAIAVLDGTTEDSEGDEAASEPAHSRDPGPAGAD